MNLSLALRITLLVLVMALTFSNAFATGDITFVDGNVSISNANGVWRIPAKGERVESGDTIVTGKTGEIHVLTDDSGFLAIRPNTQLKIEDYRANGNEDDNIALKLLRGTFRSIPGWIGKDNPKKNTVHTLTATIDSHNADHEPLIIEAGPDAGTYDKVNSGGTTMDTPFGKIDINPKQAGFVPKTGETPKVLPSIPPVFQPTQHEDVVDKAKEQIEKATDEKFKARQKNNERKGGGKSGKPKLGDAEDSRKASAALQDLFNAYERGDTLDFRNRLDPSMIGFQKLVDDITHETNECKQLRINLLDTQVQAGPDIAAIQTRWQKRCLLLPNFSPQLFSGQTTFLIHRTQAGWSLAGLTGNNPFVSTRIAATVTATVTANVPVGTCVAIRLLPAAASLPTTITVTDPDRAGAANVLVTITTGSGDTGSISIPAAGTTGIFQRTTLPYYSIVTTNNGVVDVVPGIGCPTLTVSYTDTTTPSGTQTVSATSAIP